MSHSHSKTAVIIGSGVAGLATAIRLAVQGFAVTIYEKNSVAGGKLYMFKKDGYQFDGGPSLFTQPQNIEELFALANEPIADYFSYEKCAVACNYFYDNGKQVVAFGDSDLFANELHENLGEDKMVIKNYLSSSDQLYNKVGNVFLNYSLHKRSTWLNKRIFGALSAVKFPYLFSTLNRYNNNKFSSPEATQLFNRYATYNGSNPYKAPAMLSLIPHLEHNEGTYYPAGGMISIANALYKLAIKKGVEFKFDTTVDRIISNEGKVNGVVINDRNIFADVVVSNIDAYFTYQKLLQHAAKAKKILTQERSSSALIFYWGIKKSFSPLQLHNIFFSKDDAAEFETIFNKKKLYSDPTVYVNITSKHEPTHAPAGAENWFVMINVPANTGQDWEKLIQEAKENIISKLSKMLGTDIKSFIETEDVLDPVAIEANTGSYMGSLYGTSSNSKMAAFFRHPNFSSTIKNLYFCGGSVHPGGGIPLCFKSAKITTDLIQKDLKKQRH